MFLFSHFIHEEVHDSFFSCPLEKAPKEADCISQLILLCFIFFSVDFSPAVPCIIQSPLLWDRTPFCFATGKLSVNAHSAFLFMSLKSRWDQHPLMSLCTYFPFGDLTPASSVPPPPPAAIPEGGLLSSCSHSLHPCRLFRKSAQDLTHNPSYSPPVLSFRAKPEVVSARSFVPSHWWFQIQSCLLLCFCDAPQTKPQPASPHPPFQPLHCSWPNWAETAPACPAAPPTPGNPGREPPWKAVHTISTTYNYGVAFVSWINSKWKMS